LSELFDGVTRSGVLDTEFSTKLAKLKDMKISRKKEEMRLKNFFFWGGGEIG